MGVAESFLYDLQTKPLQTLATGLKSKKLILGKGYQSLEVATLMSETAWIVPEKWTIGRH